MSKQIDPSYLSCSRYASFHSFHSQCPRKKVGINGNGNAYRRLQANHASSKCCDSHENLFKTSPSPPVPPTHRYTALMAILPQPPNLDAFGGMAVGSVIGGMLAQVTFLPMMGCGVPSALCSSLALAARCSSRLLAAHFCCGWGHRVLINACKAIAGLLHRVRNGQRPAALPAAAGAGGVVGQRQAAAAPRPWEA